MAPRGKIDPVDCTQCSFAAKKMDGFERHLVEVHGTTVQDEWNRVHGGPVRCACGCGELTQWYGWRKGYARVKRGHNASIYAVYDAETAKKIASSRGSNWRGKPGWAKGLTKETDPRVAARAAATSEGRKAAFDRGEIVPWNKGLTTETDDRVAKQTQNLREGFQSGRLKMWHDGLTEATDERLKRKNDDLRTTYAVGTNRIWSKGETKETDPRIAKTWAHRDPMKEYERIRWSEEEIREMLMKNNAIALERIEGYKRSTIPALWMRCRSCSWQEKTTLQFARNDRCPVCTPHGSSRAEREVSDLIAALVGDERVGRNVRGVIGRQELDAFVPSHRFAMEFNGLWCHTEAAGKGDWYHAGKSRRCAELGIRLLHVFEDEWREHRDLVEAAVRRCLGLLRSPFGEPVVEGVTDPGWAARFLEGNELHVEGDPVITPAWAWVALDRATDEPCCVMALENSGSGVGMIHCAPHRDYSWDPRAVQRLTERALERAPELVGLTLEPEAFRDAGWSVTGRTVPQRWWTDEVARHPILRWSEDEAFEALGMQRIHGPPLHEVSASR